ncbi:YmdB family metallophosphoesterase, partial [Bacillus altitudinis]|uniref:YmdB family metallophosphoesterase n=1 Tax=Bacillus altitudinis TaxID=293387 RepID=UPI0016438F82
DVGMSGGYEGILGVDGERIIKGFKRRVAVGFEIAEGGRRLSGVMVEIEEWWKKGVKIDGILINDEDILFE